MKLEAVLAHCSQTSLLELGDIFVRRAQFGSAHRRKVSRVAEQDRPIWILSAKIVQLEIALGCNEIKIGDLRAKAGKPLRIFTFAHFVGLNNTLCWNVFKT